MNTKMRNGHFIMADSFDFFVGFFLGTYMDKVVLLLGQSGEKLGK